MSEEKKAPWGKAYDATLGDSRPGETMQTQVRQAAAADEGLTATTRPPEDPATHQPDNKTKPAAASVDPKEVAKGARARNQDVLPGILGKQLRAAYGELLSSPVPDRINDLIKQLEGKEAGTPARSVREGEESN